MVMELPAASWIFSVSRRTLRIDCTAWLMSRIWLLRTPVEGISAWQVTLSRPPVSASPMASTVRVVPISSAA